MAQESKKSDNRCDLPEFFWRHSNRGESKLPQCEISQVEITLSTDGPLGSEGAKVFMPLDEMILPAVLHYQTWQPEVCEFLCERAKGLDAPALIDVGANCGLISRQMLEAVPALTRAICVEPDKNNFACLERNLRDYDRVLAFNFGLSDTSGPKVFYKDAGNCGNFSFNSAAVLDKAHDVAEAETMSVTDFFDQIASDLGTGSLLWKSDTQGFDELIVASTPNRVWDRIQAAVIEMWRIDKPSYDVAALANKINDFPNKLLGGEPVDDAGDVLNYLTSRDRQHCDLWLWR